MSEEAAVEDRAVSDATHRWMGQISERLTEEYWEEVSTSYLSGKLPNKTSA